MCSRNIQYGGFLDTEHTWKSDVEICLQELSIVGFLLEIAIRSLARPLAIVKGVYIQSLARPLAEGSMRVGRIF
jgi:hypothetical protein